MEKLTFDVGKDKEWTSLSALFYALRDDEREKTIRVFPGVYDIFQEYRALNLETPPDEIAAGDYLTRCIFLPKNTRLIGVREDGMPEAGTPTAVLLWNPKKEEITKGEARTWSPLNVRYGCSVENLTILCRYGRYCIHDDSHNADEDQGVKHVYRNVHAIYRFSEDSWGFNNTLGFGFSQKNEYLFENCTFEMKDCPPTSLQHSAFYGHAAGGRTLSKEDGPTILVKNCRLLGGCGENLRTARFQSLNRCPLHVKAWIEDCEIEGGVHANLYYEDAQQAFEIAVVRSGTPQVTVDDETHNPYPVRILPEGE